MKSNFLVLSVFVVATLLSSCGSCENNKVADRISKKDAALSVIYNRKSVRNFVKDKPVSSDDLQTLVKAGMAAPSGKDTRPWEFVVIDDRDVLNKLADELPTAKMLMDASAAIIVCGDSVKSSYWYLDCSAATQNVLLAAEALGLGAVWTAAYPYSDRMEIVNRNIGLPAHILPLVVIPIGYPAEEGKAKDKFDETKIHHNKW